MLSDEGFGGYLGELGVYSPTAPAINIPWFDLGSIDIPGLIDRRDVSPAFQSPPMLDISAAVAKSLEVVQIYEQINMGEIPVVAQIPLQPPPVIIGPPVAIGGPINRGDDMADLGSFGESIWNVVTDLGSQLIQSKYGQQTLPGIVYSQFGPDLTGANLPQVSSPVTVIPGTGGPMNGASGMCPVIPPGYVYDAKMGCLKRKTRKRRKRLATASDIADLSALKSVLGNGEAFKTWIATH